MTAPLIQPSDGCQYCGVARRGHAQQWKPPVGWHKWEPPTREQIRARYLAQRAARLAARRNRKDT